MRLLPISESPEACVPIQGLSHGAVLTSTVDVRPLRACKIAVNGNFMCHTECKWALQISLGLSVCVSDSRKAQAQWLQAVGREYYCAESRWHKRPKKINKLCLQPLVIEIIDVHKLFFNEWVICEGKYECGFKHLTLLLKRHIIHLYPDLKLWVRKSKRFPLHCPSPSTWSLTHREYLTSLLTCLLVNILK